MKANVAVIIPTLARRKELLIAAIESAISCRVGMILVISPSNAPDWLPKSFNGSLSWVTFSGGLVESLNHAARLVPHSFEFLTWLGDDDLLDPKGYRELRTIPDADLIIGRCGYITESGDLVRVQRVHKWRVQAWTLALVASPIAQPATIFRRSLFESLGGLDTKYQYAFDQDFFTRAIVGGAKLKIVGNQLAFYRVHEDTLSSTNWEKSLMESANVREMNSPTQIAPFARWVDKIRHLLVTRFRAAGF